MIAAHTVLFEEIVLGYFRFSCDRPIERSGAGALLKACEAERLLTASLIDEVRAMLNSRNDFIHADRKRELPANSPRLTDRNIWAKTYYRVPEAVAAELLELHEQRASVGGWAGNDGSTS